MFLKKEIHYVLLENKNVIVKTCTGKHILLTQNQVKRYVLRPRTGHDDYDDCKMNNYGTGTTDICDDKNQVKYTGGDSNE